MDYPKLISEKWNLTAKFNCLQAIYFDAPIALAVPMCAIVWSCELKVKLRKSYQILTSTGIMCESQCSL